MSSHDLYFNNQNNSYNNYQENFDLRDCIPEESNESSSQHSCKNKI